MSASWLLALGVGIGYLINKQGNVVLEPDDLDSIEDTLREENHPDDNIPTRLIRNLQELSATNAGSSDLTNINSDLPPGDVEQIKMLGVARRAQMTNGITPADKMGTVRSKLTLEHERQEVKGVEWNDGNGYKFD